MSGLEIATHIQQSSCRFVKGRHIGAARKGFLSFITKQLSLFF